MGMYNDLVQLRVHTDSAWSDIDVQLERRHDLIANTRQNRQRLRHADKRNIRKRCQSRCASYASDRAGEGEAVAEYQLTGALKSLFAVAENYAELKPQEEFTQLREEYAKPGQKRFLDFAANSHHYYNTVVRGLNAKIQSFPTNILADVFSLRAHQFFRPLTPSSPSPSVSSLP